jgi:hypothetical protein
VSKFPQITTYHIPGVGVPWRFTFLIEGYDRDNLVSAIREKGFDASTWFPCVADWFGYSDCNDSNVEKYFPVSCDVENKIVNLWLTDEYIGEKSDMTINLISKYLSKNE